MSNRTVNDKQHKVLGWLATGATQDPPEPEMKLSAAALKSRGLVRIRRPGGRWTAELTDAGRYYLAHGTYPAAPVPAPRPARQKKLSPGQRELAQPVASSAPGHALAPDRSAMASDQPEEVPLKQVLRRPHAAVMELRDRPGRLPKFARRRCLLMAHSLVTEALSRGWEVTPVVGKAERDQ